MVFSMLSSNQTRSHCIVMRKTGVSINLVLIVSMLVNFQLSCITKFAPNLSSDQLALLALKAHITYDPYGIVTSNWTDSNSVSVCAWIGVTCSSRHNRVAALDLSNMGVKGTIPPEIGNLSFLSYLNLMYNNFSGNLPRELASLRRLKYLSLRVNNFSGEIPSWLGRLKKLDYLSLTNNSFYGSIPSSISNLSNLQVLDFSFNSLQGNIPIEMGNLSNLKSLIIQGNHLSGPIPSPIFNLSLLESIGFTSNQLNGFLPTHICKNLPFIRNIYLSLNMFSGEIPKNISSCTYLQGLSLSSNLFSGQIPREIGKLKLLELLYLGNNKLTGTIPEGIGNLHNLVLFTIDRNQISGTIPLNFFNVSSLQTIDLLRNNLTGSIPKEIGNTTRLIFLELSENNLSGDLPEEFSQLHHLEVLSLGYNNFVGATIPLCLFNKSTLQVLSLPGNDMLGSLPTNLGYGLPCLKELFLGLNYLTGVIPVSISNCSQLTILSLGYNNFLGDIPCSIGNLRLLEYLHLPGNKLIIPSLLMKENFIASLTNCKLLYYMDISDCSIYNTLPTSIGNLSTLLKTFHASSCEIKGIPSEIGNLSNLVDLDLGSNLMIDTIPFSIKNLHSLQSLLLQGNNLRGPILNDLCNLSSLAYLFLSNNKFSGPIPQCLGKITYLRELHMDSNMLTSSIPTSIWQLQDLLVLNLSSNFLSGMLPLEIRSLVEANSIDLSKNQLFGNLPITIGDLQGLAELFLGYNSLQGSIPSSMGSMLNLRSLDLSYNRLSGSIPMSLTELSELDYFNVSFNALIGEIPSNGSFRNFTMESFIGNEALCGISKFHVPPCRNVTKHRSKKVRFTLIILSGVMACLMIFVLTIVIISKYRKKVKASQILNTFMPIVPERFSYYELLQATENFSESNLLGMGGIGSVFKGSFTNGRVLAIKVFNLQLEVASQSFDVECEVLRSIRHRNLTKVLGNCSNEDFKALVLEYMTNGSLEKWLYSHNYCLDVNQRLSIMIDVAFALEYLHHGYSVPIVHRDLKPSNVLLDEEMVAHVSDFGIAKLLTEGNSIIHTNTTLATLGYIAPEYGFEGLLSTRCDVYSYGIILMETFTRKRPSDEMFAENLSLKCWIEGLLPESLDQVIDANLIYPETENYSKIMQCISYILDLALKCSAENPRDRMNMKEVIVELQKIRCQLLA